MSTNVHQVGTKFKLNDNEESISHLLAGPPIPFASLFLRERDLRPA